MKTKTKNLYNFGEMIDLNQPGVEKAREWMRSAATDGDWWHEYVTDELWAHALHQIGFENAKIAFSGFWCQGDGASFTADVNTTVLLQFLGSEIEGKDCIDADSDGKEDFRPYIVHKTGGVAFDYRYKWLADIAEEHIAASCKRSSSQYSHKNTCTFEAEFNDEHSKVSGKWIDSDPPGNGHWKSGVPHVEALFLEFVKDAEQLRLDLCDAIYKDLEAEYEYRTSDEAIREDSEANEYLFDESGHRENA